MKMSMLIFFLLLFLATLFCLFIYFDYITDPRNSKFKYLIETGEKAYIDCIKNDAPSSILDKINCTKNYYFDITK